MTYQQIAGQVRVPAGKKVAVGLGVDFDALSLWDGTFHQTSPTYLSRGEFVAEVAAQRLLKLFEKHHIKTTWCIPGHTVETFPDPCKEALAAGHEIAHHGYVHENPTEVDRQIEREVLLRGLDALARICPYNSTTFPSCALSCAASITLKVVATSVGSTGGGPP